MVWHHSLQNLYIIDIVAYKKNFFFYNFGYHLLANPNACAFRRASTRFFALPRLFSNLDVSIEAALRLTDLPVSPKNK